MRSGQDVLITECAPGFFDGENIPDDYLPLLPIYHIFPMHLTPQHLGDNIHRPRMWCIMANRNTMIVDVPISKGLLLKCLGRRCDLPVECMFRAPLDVVRDMVEKMAEVARVPSTWGFRSLLNGTHRGRLDTYERKVAEMETKGKIADSDFVILDLDHNSDARPRIGVSRLFSLCCHFQLWLCKLDRVGHVFEALECHGFPVWQCKEGTTLSPFRKLFTDTVGRESDMSWQCMVGNSQHVPTYGAVLCFALACVRRRGK